MTIESESVEFLEWHISNKYKEIFDKYLINQMEWMDMLDSSNELRPYALIKDAETNKVSNIIVLFPPFKPSAPIN